MAIFAEVTENECIINELVRDIQIHFAIYLQHIEMPFAPYGRAMLVFAFSLR